MAMMSLLRRHRSAASISPPSPARVSRSDVLDVLSLAQGRLIRWSIRQVFAGDAFVSGVCRGRKDTTPPFEPLFSHLHLQPVLDLAITKYTAALRDRTGLDVAIEW